MYQIFNELHQEKLLLLLLCFPLHKKEGNKKAANFSKKLDFVSSLLKIEDEAARQLLWGVRTFYQQAVYTSRINGVFLDINGRGDDSYVQGFCLKANITVLVGGFLNSPITRGISQFPLFRFFSGGQNVWVFGGIVPLQALLLIIMREVTIMTKNITHSQSTKTKSIKTKSYQQSNQQNDCKKAVILMKSKSLEEDIRLKEKMLELASRHNLSVIAVIPVPHEYDAEALERLITVIKAAKEQVTVITDNCEYIHRYNILGCCVLGTMVRFEHVQLVAYAHDISGKLFLYFPNISNIKFFHIAEMNIWKLTNGDDIQAANKQLIQKQNGGN